jgi:GNAT superfamily N-acetyltransferase
MEYKDTVIFSQYDLVSDREFLIAAHTETFRLTFNHEITREWLDVELTKFRDVRDGAYLDGKLIGICDLTRRNPDQHDEYGNVEFYFIAPDYRNRGLGGQLIEHSVDWCRTRGLKTLYLRTGRDNFQAQKCYERNGFVRHPETDNERGIRYVKHIAP